MAYKIDFYGATSNQIETALCKRLESIRLSRNMTQRQLATEAGVGSRTIYRLEKGQGVTFDTFIRVLTALGVQQNLETLLPDPEIRPIERVDIGGSERIRARPSSSLEDNVKWSWGDGEVDDE